MRMNARLQRPQSAGLYQVHALNVKVQFNDKAIKQIGFQKAVVESEFNYKNCCNDEDGKEKVLDYKNMCFKNF